MPFLLNNFFLRNGHGADAALGRGDTALICREPTLWQESGEDAISLALLSSVALQEQFEFALTAVAEEVNAILKALPQ